MRTTARLIAVVAVLAVSFALTPAAQAATIAVNTTADEYNTGTACSLREAIQAANDDAPFGGCSAGSGADTIELPAGTYTLTIGSFGEDANAEGDLDVASDITIDPTGVVVVDGTKIDRVFEIFGGAGTVLSVSDLTIRNGKTTSDAGAGISTDGGGLTLTGVTLTANEAIGNGGAVAVAGGGTTSLTNVTVSGNTATGDGGGLGIFSSGTTTINNVTVANNTADNDADNTGNGGGIFVQSGTVNISNSIVGDNTDNSTGASPKHPDCSGTLASQGYNLIEDTAGCTIGGSATGNITGQAPRLEPLADNGGPTQTHEPRKNSPVIDKANPAAPGSGGAACAATDQRGVKRPQGPRCDIGAVEVSQAGGAQCLGQPITITGTSGNDLITGTKKRDVIQALSGDDVVDALGGNDRVCAGSGNDRVLGRTGRDQVAGQAGNDRGIGHGGDDLLRGQGGRDRLKGKGGDDTLRGGAEPDRLNGGGGFDVCRGGGGADVIRRCEERS
jgi:CSLREA domain-containing protein